jgi:hypothetical protein
VGFCAFYKHFSGFGFFLLPSIIHARPHAGNANRWGAEPKPNTKPSLIRKFRFIVEIKNQIQFLAVVFFK